VVHRFLDEAWCAAVRDLGPLPPAVTDLLAGGPVVVRVELAGPDGDARLDVRLEAGRPVEVGPAEAPAAAGADLVLTLSRADARAVVDGALRLDTAYMQGRAKLAGDHGRALRLLAASAGEGWERARSRLAAVTGPGAS
jgi:hypothetical protein